MSYGSTLSHHRCSSHSSFGKTLSPIAKVFSQPIEPRQMGIKKAQTVADV